MKNYLLMVVNLSVPLRQCCDSGAICWYSDLFAYLLRCWAEQFVEGYYVAVSQLEVEITNVFSCSSDNFIRLTFNDYIMHQVCVFLYLGGSQFFRPSAPLYDMTASLIN